MALKTTRVALATAVTFVVGAAWLIGGWSPEGTTSIVSNILQAASSGSAAVFASLAARSGRGRRRTAWVALAVGLWGWFLGQLIWSYYEIVAHQDPFPSLADVGYLILPVGACAALLLFPDDYSNLSLGRALLDGLIVAGSLFLVSWVMVLGPVYEARSEQDRLEFSISMAYPISDVVVLTVAAMVLIRAKTQQRLVLTLLTVGMACIALADSAFLYLGLTGNYTSGTTTDLGWVAGFLLLTVAGAADRGAETRTTMRNSCRLGLDLVAVRPATAGRLVAAVEPPRVMGSRPVLTTGVLLMGAVLGRQFLAVSENRRLLITVAEQARRDPLTGLANRTLLYERLEHAMRLRERDTLCVGVLSLDLNDFKLVNDTFGHHAGDKLLIDVADRLNACVRASDTVARLGGDEFVVVVEDSADQSRLVAERVLGAFDEPFSIDGHPLTMLPSLGLAIAQADEPNLSVDELLRRSDVAMYASKRLRTRGVQTFTPQSGLAGTAGIDCDPMRRAPLRSAATSGAEQLELLGELRQAITRSELTLLYQPQIDLNTAQIVGAEALLRWAHPQRGPLGADEFLPLVRRYGLMESVNELVLNQALDAACRWHAASVDIPVSVNLFAPTLANPELPGTILRALADRGLDPAALTVEITEQLLIADVDRTRTVLQELRCSGVRIALDDFGSGFSTLSHLRDLPIDELKLDRDFIAPLRSDRRTAALVAAVISFAHALDLSVVAEGIEDAETAALLRTYRCDQAQGHYYSPAVPPQALADMFITAAR